MEKIAYIKDFEVPMLFAYPPSKVALGFGFPLLVYALILLPLRTATPHSLLELAIVVLIHGSLFAALGWIIHRKFPRCLLFEAGGLSYRLFFGGHHCVPYEELVAILEAPEITVFSFKDGQKLLFLPAQTHRQRDFKDVLGLLQLHLQTRVRS